MPETRWLKINPARPEPGKIEEIVRVLEKGGLAAFPTETVYGLAALAENRRAVRKIYRLKKRPQGKALTVQVASVKKIADLIPAVPDEAQILLKQFCPGPITLILKKKRGKIGIRIPAHKISLAILKKINRPLVVTSANLSGRKDPVTADEVRRNFDGRIEAIVDGGRTRAALPSTVIDLSGKRWRILRPGKIKLEKVREALA
ncbi:MAG: L-threonylcarbamoyladenylate synthase [Candidatus Ratteibacteria bacterium]|nr:L-threonylcarbamoyladenylate synthase [Candidatus Ratteibacteria bacterium]